MGKTLRDRKYGKGRELLGRSKRRKQSEKNRLRDLNPRPRGGLIPPGKTHRSQKDYRRNPKHKGLLDDPKNWLVE